MGRKPIEKFSVSPLYIKRFFDRLKARGWRGPKCELRNDDLVREARAYSAYCRVVFGVMWTYQHLIHAIMTRGLVYTYGSADHFKISWELVDRLVISNAS